MNIYKVMAEDDNIGSGKKEKKTENRKISDSAKSLSTGLYIRYNRYFLISIKVLILFHMYT